MFTSIEALNEYLNERKRFGMKLGLKRISTLLNSVGNPEQSTAVIHVAGTNGKGSTIHFLDVALRASGYCTGIFSSPSLTDVRGYFTLNGKESDAIGLIETMNKLYPHILKLDEENDHPTEFEIVTVLAFMYFAERTDFILLETGMGGLYDTTNCTTPLLSIITTVAKDHEQFLGDTIEQIATHKAGIIKKNRPVIIGNVPDVAEKVIEKRAYEVNAPIYRLGKEFFLVQNGENRRIKIGEKTYELAKLTVKGTHQWHNVTLCCIALHLLKEHGYFIDEKEALFAITNTKVPGRFEQIYKRPILIVDSAHNVQAIRALLATIRSQFRNKRISFLFTAYRDKAWEEMIHLILQAGHTVTVTTFSDKRALTVEEIRQRTKHLNVVVELDWKSFILNMLEQNRDEICVITGSFRFISLVRSLLLVKK